MGDPTTERGGGAVAGGGHIGAMLGAGLPLSLTRSIDLLVPFAPPPSLAAPRAHVAGQAAYRSRRSKD